MRTPRFLIALVWLIWAPAVYATGLDTVLGRGAGTANVQGNGTKVQLSTGSPTSGDAAKFDSNGNTADSGIAPGGPGAVTVATANVGSGLTPALPALTNSMQILTMNTGSATITIPAGQYAGQLVMAIICQNGTGGYVPTIAAAGGLTLVGTAPTFTTTANKCGDMEIQYSTTTNAYITRSAAGPL